MFSRTGTQFIVFFVLSLLGMWIIHNDLIPPSEGGFAFYDGMIAAMYWFAFLLYMLLSVVIGLTIRKRSWKGLFIVHILSAGIALAGTVVLINKGQQFATNEGQLEEQALEQVIIDESS